MRSEPKAYLSNPRCMHYLMSPHSTERRCLFACCAQLHNRPPWAEAPRSPSPYGQHTPPPPQGPSPSPSPLPPLPALGRPHRGSSSGALLHPDHTTTAAAGGHSEGGAPAAAANGGGGATSPGHRRTSSHPLPVAVLAGGVGGGGVEGVGRSPLNKASGLQQDTSHQQLHYQEHTDSDNGTGGVGGRASPAVGVDADMLGQGAGEGSAEGEEARAGAEEQHEEAERARKEQREGEDAALAAWARHPSHAAWKTLEWLVQVGGVSGRWDGDKRGDGRAARRGGGGGGGRGPRGGGPCLEGPTCRDVRLSCGGCVPVAVWLAARNSQATWMGVSTFSRFTCFPRTFAPTICPLRRTWFGSCWGCCRTWDLTPPLSYVPCRPAALLLPALHAPFLQLQYLVPELLGLLPALGPHSVTLLCIPTTNPAAFDPPFL